MQKFSLNLAKIPLNNYATNKMANVFTVFSSRNLRVHKIAENCINSNKRPAHGSYLE